ncbi:hypothetical protein Scep_009147 [Stephania cephalantha]|uniref:Shikimate dehydrogenase (NADP(+)) n=1 Tax=Stephania cephalantha TaxID=152367 RepID=A0AAP0PG07_9MAGN
MSNEGGSKICVPILGESAEQMLVQMDKAKLLGADLVEIRLDYLQSFEPRRNLKLLIGRCPLPTVFTYRPKWEGGKYEGDEDERLDALRLAMEQGADYVDVEFKVASKFINSISQRKPEKCKVIVSSHNFHNTPSSDEIGDLATRMQAVGADIVKIVTTALDISDVLRIFQLTMNSQVPVIGLAMNERGLTSRLLCPKFGGYLTYASLEKGQSSAPWQPKIDDLLNIFNFRLLGPNTKVAGLIGNPVGHSKATTMFNPIFKTVEFDGVYVPFLVDDVPNFLKSFNSPNFVGWSCTIPHKEEALRSCDEVDPVAKSIGAVNTIIRKPDGKFIGYNTDYFGAISAIENKLRVLQNLPGGTGSPLSGKLFVVMGAGGTGKALSYGAKAKGARVVVANRTYSRAKEIADSVGGEALALAELENYHPEEGAILANTTCVGMQPNDNESPIPKHALKRYSLVFDAVYTPKMTRLLRDAEESGVTIVTGVDMFIIQAYEQYERFTNLPAPKELFWEVMSGY